MNVNLGVIDLDAIDLDELRTHRATMLRGLAIVDGLIGSLETFTNGAPQLPAPPPAEPAPAEPGPIPDPPAPTPPEPDRPDTPPIPDDARLGDTLNARPPAERAAACRAAVQSALTSEWEGGGVIAERAGVGSGTATAYLRKLTADGIAEHNGKGGAWSRYRTAPDPPVAATVDPPEAPVPVPAPAGVTDRQATIMRILAKDRLSSRELAAGLVRNLHDVERDLRALHAQGRVRYDDTTGEWEA